MKFLRTMFFFFFVFSSIQALAQTPLQTTGPVASEKIFVHTDKDYYVAGEILWYKMYLLNQGIDLNLSRVAYIEIIGKDGKAALQVKTAVDQGNGNGSIVLPSSIPSGNYILRAYTRWMRNAGPVYFFHKQITIVNTLKKSEPVSGPEIKTIHLQLFPEGGDLVNDLQSRIAFLATDQYGRGVSGRGFVTSETLDTLASFATSRFGMGSFSFTPKAGKSYNASFVQENGQKVSVKLPSPIEWGYVMSAENTGDLLRISVAGNNQKFGQVGLTVVHHGANVYQQTKNTADGKAVFEIDRTKLP
ncbi:MAG: hypothetical protein H7Y27_16105, partial [Gemmatimonadaceae bacterium]|nr:hypothetical protein [Chitinophagaceae bacterium]